MNAELQGTNLTLDSTWSYNPEQSAADHAGTPRTHAAACRAAAGSVTADETLFEGYLLAIARGNNPMRTAHKQSN